MSHLLSKEKLKEVFELLECCLPEEESEGEAFLFEQGQHHIETIKQHIEALEILTGLAYSGKLRGFYERINKLGDKVAYAEEEVNSRSKHYRVGSSLSDEIYAVACDIENYANEFEGAI